MKKRSKKTSKEIARDKEILAQLGYVKVDFGDLWRNPETDSTIYYNEYDSLTVILYEHAFRDGYNELVDRQIALEREKRELYNKVPRSRRTECKIKWK